MEIIIAGFGGQGTVLAGNILATASMIEDKFVTGMFSYGIEMRGGTTNTSIIISDKEIASPFIVKPDVAVVLNPPSLDRFEDSVVPGGIIVVNTSMIKRDVKRKDVDVVEVPATNTAIELGNVRTANIVALGALIKKTGILKIESVAQAIEELFSSKKPELVEINKTALQKGTQICEIV